MATLIKHSGGPGDRDGAPVTKFLEAASAGSFSNDPMRLAGVLADTHTDAIRADPLFYAFNIVLTCVGIFYLTRLMRRLLA